MASKVRVRLLIEGRVQGVWFRDSTRQEARRLDLAGWVRNVPDGRVEVVVEGPADQVRNLINWCHRGPPLARVSKVEQSDEDWKGEFDAFDIVF